NYGSSWIQIAHAFLGQLDSVESAMEDWLAIGKAIGCLGAYIYLMRAYSLKTMKGEPFLVADFINPILIALLLSVYTPVTKGLESLFLGTNDATEVLEGNTEELLRITSEIERDQLETEQDVQEMAQSGGPTEREEDALRENGGGDGISFYEKAKYYFSMVSNPGSLIPNLMKWIL